MKKLRFYIASARKNSGGVEFSVKESLQRSEWVFFAALVSLISVVFTVSKFNSYRSFDLFDQSRDREEMRVEVEVSGHVKRPGCYQVAKGSSLQEVFFQARPKLLADFSPFDLNERVEKSCSFHVNALEKINIQVIGCVKKNLTLEVPAGSRICDLRGLIEPTSEADKGFLRRRRILRNLEVLTIPSSRK